MKKPKKPTAAYKRLGLTEAEVRDKLWDAFSYWMRGQTCAEDSTGTPRFYYHDVDRACRALQRTYIAD